MITQTGEALRREGEAALQAAGIEGYQRDVALLFRHALTRGTQQQGGLHQVDHALRNPASAALREDFRLMISARAARQPVSQIIGRRAFYEHDFIVTPDTLDPRPETETLVHEALKLPWRNLLDLGTGSGAILLSLLAARPGTVGTGTDISAAALEVAGRNAKEMGVHATLFVSDWFEKLGGTFDLIVSNPPYIAQSEMADLAPEVRDWEPAMALTDGADGLNAYRVIASQARTYLNPRGYLLLEIGWRQADAVTNLLAKNGAQSRVMSDLGQRDRVVLAQFDG